MKRVTVIGGGKGQSILLKGLKNIEGLDLKAIVTVADDGGSTGRLRHDFNLPAMGDIRAVMLALSNEEQLLAHIMDYRFDSLDSKSLGGHNLGNLILTALTKKTGSFMEAVGSLSKVLKVQGEIIPSSLETLTLIAEMRDGTIVRGESNIPLFANQINRVFYDREVVATPQAIDAILNADIIVLGVGSLYTSILPNVVIPQLRRALEVTNAKIIYYCNVMTQPGETDGYDGEAHAQAILDHANIKLDIVVADNSNIPNEIMANYFKEDSSYVSFDKKNAHDYKIMYDALTSIDNGMIRHDSKKIEKNFRKIIEVI